MIDGIPNRPLYFYQKDIIVFNHFFVLISRYLTGYLVKTMAMVDIQSQRSDFGREKGVNNGGYMGVIHRGYKLYMAL